MSIVKFGHTDKDTDSNDVERRFGKKDDRITYWKFGEPVNFYILDTLKNYLPRFIVQNNLCNAILKGIAIQLVEVELETQKLPGFVMNSTKASLRYANSDLQLHLSLNSKPNVVKQAIQDAYIIHKERGTIPGIVKDLRRLTGDNSAYVIYYGYEDCGWWVDYTYPEYNSAGKVGNNTNVYYDLYNMLDLVFCNHSGLTDEELKKLIRREIVPINIDVRFLISTTHTIKWGEPYDYISADTLQFGVFIFGQKLGGCGQTSSITELEAISEGIEEFI